MDPALRKWLDLEERCLKKCEDCQDDLTDVDDTAHEGKLIIKYREAKRTEPRGRCNKYCVDERCHTKRCRCILHYLKEEDPNNTLGIEMVEKPPERGLVDGLLCPMKCEKTFQEGRVRMRCGQRCNGAYQHQGRHRCQEHEEDEDATDRMIENNQTREGQEVHEDVDEAIREAQLVKAGKAAVE
jgi:hypothetical protein